MITFKKKYNTNKNNILTYGERREVESRTNSYKFELVMKRIEVEYIGETGANCYMGSY